MKKVTALFIAFTLACSLSGCSGTSTDGNSSSELWSGIFGDNSNSSYTDATSTENSTDSKKINNSYTDSGDTSSDYVVPQKQQPEYVAFFNQKAVHTLSIEMADSAWNAICASPKDKEYQSANITVDDITVSDCGIKTHGNSTLNEAVKAGKTCFPFKIKFDKYTDNTFLGLDELVLCNNYIDVSYARQYAGYEALRVLDAYTPLCTFFNVYVNGELLGLYTGVEEIDNSFLDRIFDSTKHNLYKADELSTLTPDMESWAMKQKKGKDTSKADLKKLIKVLDEMPLGEKGEIESVLDVDSALKYIAAGAVIHHCDGYGGYSAHNYCLYADDGVFHVIPWDMDLCFYQTGWGFAPSPGAQMDIKDGLTGEAEPKDRPLITKLLAVDEYYKIYLGYCEDVLEWLKEYNSQGCDELYELLQDSVKNDPRGKYSLFNSEFNHTYHYGFAGYINERVEYLEKRIPEIYQEMGF